MAFLATSPNRQQKPSKPHLQPNLEKNRKNLFYLRILQVSDLPSM